MNLHQGKKYTDLSYLHTLSKGNTSFEQKMLKTFIQQTTTDMKKLKQSLDDEDWDSIFLIAHKMKPSLQFVGLSLLHGDVLSLETLARQRNDVHKTAELISEISSVIDLAMEEIKEELIVFEN
jgi:HPt (histidine-containing phosphotransfer) domain-containing protein